jgi:hypothetical protein
VLGSIAVNLIADFSSKIEEALRFREREAAAHVAKWSSRPLRGSKLNMI